MNTLKAIQAALENERAERTKNRLTSLAWNAGNVYRVEYRIFVSMWIRYDKFFKKANELADWLSFEKRLRGDAFQFERLWMRDDGADPELVDDIAPHIVNTDTDFIERTRLTGVGFNPQVSRGTEHSAKNSGYQF